MQDIRLHVFGHNQRALQLYQRIGYEISDSLISVFSQVAGPETERYIEKWLSKGESDK